MTMVKIESTRKNEKGIALIFTLIMLSLLLILALAFALDSMFEQKSAYNSASASSARILAEAQLKQVLALIKAEETNFAAGNIYSRDFHEAVPANMDTDMLKEQTPPTIPYSCLRVYGVLDENNDNSCLTGTPPDVKWNYIRNGPLVTDTIIGRTAFVVIPDAKIPLDSLVDDRSTAPATYPQHNEKDDTETRIGKYVSEINVRAAISPLPTSSANIIPITEALNWNTVASGLYTGSWASFDALFTAINGVITPALSTGASSDETQFTSNLSLSVADDKEVFWADKNANVKIDDTELIRRFNLTRTDWDGLNTHADDLTFIRTQILLDTTNTGVPTQAMQEWLDTDTNTTITSGLPWLACFGYKTDGTVDAALNGTFASTVDRRNQIAANLKDYCDTDNRPTSDVDPSTWETSVAPLFTGNEKTPYINEVGACVIATYNATGSGPYNVKAVLELRGYAELINIYGANWTDDLEVVIKGQVKIFPTIDGTAKPEETKAFDVVVDVGSATWNNGYSSLAYTADATTPLETITYVSVANAIKVEVTEVKIERVVLRKKVGSDKYDYVKTLTKTSTKEILTGSGTGYGWYCWAVHDPRQNLNSGDWKELDPPVATVGDTPAMAFSVGAGTEANSNAPSLTDLPSAGDDAETGADPANGNLSTAFIRNAPMESPWELGFIHRGAKWQTINLKKYVPSKGISAITIGVNQYIAGGGLYAAGDANILDQIKMTAEAKSPQKINLSASDTIFFDALFSKIRLGADTDSTMTVTSMAGLTPTFTPSTGTEIVVNPPTVAYSSMRDAIIIWFKIPDIATFTNLTRASVVGISTGLLNADEVEPPAIGFASASTDAGKEELIGKIVNLTKVGKGTGNFTIIVVAQTIKDVGGSGGTVDIWKTPADGSTALRVPSQLGVFDVNDNSGATPNEWRDDAYADEITSEQKILVKGSFDGTTLKITSFQYIE